METVPPTSQDSVRRAWEDEQEGAECPASLRAQPPVAPVTRWAA